MIRSVLLACLLLVSLRAEGSKVVTATDSDFDDIITKQRFALVNFYAMWCRHSRALLPEWEKAAAEVPETVPLVNVNCTEKNKLKKKYNIRHYPTIILFRDGKVVERYSWPRRSRNIVAYVKLVVESEVHHLSSAEELQKMKESHDTVCVGLTAENDSPLSKTMEAAAKNLRSRVKFVIITDPKLSPDEKPESITVFRKGGEKEIFEGNMEATELTVFLGVATFPFAGEITPQTHMDYAEFLRTTAWVLLKPSEEASKQLKPQLLELGKKLRRDVILFWVDVDQYQVGDNISVPSDAKYPAFAILRYEKHFVLPTSEPATVERIEKFVAEFVKGDVRPALKSQPVPEQETVEGLTTVVGSTLDRYLSSGKDMLIEFFAPWCGHCKNLAPILVKVAKEFESSDVIIAAMDATANHVDSSQFLVSGYPTIYFVPHGGKPIAYDGDRTFHELCKFVREHGTFFKTAPSSLDSTEQEPEEQEPEEPKPEEKEPEEQELEEQEKGVVSDRADL